MKKTHFTCYNCSEEIDLEEVGGKPYKDGRHTICDDCYRRLFQLDCPLCEEYFSNKTPKPKDYFFVVMPADVKIAGMASGIYRGKSYPIWTSDMFTTTIEERNVELVKPLNKLILNQHDHTNQICPDCFKKYTDDTWLETKRKIILINSLLDEMSHRFYKVIKKHKGNLKYFNRLFKPTRDTLLRRRSIFYNNLRKIENKL